MCCWKKIVYPGITLICLLSIKSYSQGLTIQEWIARQFLEAFLVRNQPAEKVLFKQELDYSMTSNCMFVLNQKQSENRNQAGLCQNLKYKCSIIRGTNFYLTNVFIHQLGFQYYFDSITQVNLDENSLNTRLELKIARKLSVGFNSILSSQLLNGFEYMPNDSGQNKRVINSAFLTPLIWTFSWGLSYSLPGYGSVNVGITGGKLTYLRQTDIFEIRGVNYLYGVEKGGNHLFEYGMTLHLLIDKDLHRSVHWNCDLLLFKNYDSPIDLTLKNLLGYKINKYIRTSLSTKIFYEENLTRRLQVENLLSVGFYIHL